MWKIRDREWDLDQRCLVMGILNLTPDSFSDGGQFTTVDQAVKRGLEMTQEGADILDLGAESTRPGAEPVSLEEECRRLLPVVEALSREVETPISIDTYKAEVARRCLDVGASIINDVTAMGCNFESESEQVNEAMIDAVREHRAGVILMHMQGTPQTMQQSPTYEDAVEEILRFFQRRIETLTSLGIECESLAVDPGVGFGKNDDHNWALIRQLSQFQSLNRPVCLGVSRKGLLGRLLDKPVERRDAGSLAIACHAMSQKVVQILRVHDVAGTSDAVRVFSQL